jgi:metal-responsive CopG/Arc/MetJ family transcriptional regulator
LVSINIMNSQVNIRLNPKLLSSAKTYAKNKGYSSVQELIKETLREKIFEEKSLSDEEAVLLSKLIDATKSKKLFKTEEELFKKLRG